ncbi:hypothetical protein E0L36_18345 [Streptomyces sp. AJS327]|uniref:J domain-containing protein n=1 Tax=Streptomyces sp. AJS327 TaxID=2545265 RepID=UPI0015DEA284|nr:J domain-containing protein [Streptomyces sp. AJS327]MBA0052765.1 hypothetical protein [Streptomyces sp. AJS327]
MSANPEVDRPAESSTGPSPARPGERTPPPDPAGGPDWSGGTDAASPGDSPTADPAPDVEAEAVERLDRAVRTAETALIEYEIAVETFRVEVDNFSRLHHQRLGPMYARLDELDAQIAEAVAARTGDPEDERRAREARGVVMPMPGVEELFMGWIDSGGFSPEAEAMLSEKPVTPPSRVRPSEEARRAYRELVRQAHPDLAQDDAERERREAFIVRVNRAYAEGDTATLEELAREWAAGPAAPQPQASRAEELYARLEWLARRKEMLAEVAAELEESAIGAMLRMAPDDPDALLEEIAEQLLAQVAEREAELERQRALLEPSQE